MSKLNHLTADADKFYAYLSDRMTDIEEQLKSDKYFDYSNLSLERLESRIWIEATQTSDIRKVNRRIEIFEVDCDDVDLYSSLFDLHHVEFDAAKIFRIADLFEQGIITTENVVFVVVGDTSTEPYAVDYFVRGIFTDLTLAFRHVDKSFRSIIATKLDADEAFYVGGYTE